MKAPANAHRSAVKRVLGSELKVGDVTVIQGYRWRVVAPPREEECWRSPEERNSVLVRGEGHGEGKPVKRWLVEVSPADEQAASNGPGYARWTSGLRSDLPWYVEAKQ